MAETKISSAGVTFPDTTVQATKAFSGQIKTGTFTSDTADGDQAVTGVGFQPDFIIVAGEVTRASIAIYDGTKKLGISEVNGGTPLAISNAILLQPWTDGSNYINGVFKTLDADGFTITWSGLTGTAPARAYFYIAFKA